MKCFFGVLFSLYFFWISQPPPTRQQKPHFLEIRSNQVFYFFGSLCFPQIRFLESLKVSESAYTYSLIEAAVRNNTNQPFIARGKTCSLI